MRKAPSRPSSSLPSLAPTTPRGSSSTKIVVPERARTMLLFIVCCVGLVTTTAAARLYTNYGWWYAAWLRRSPPPTRRRACLPSTQSTKKKKIGIVALRQQASSVLARYAQTAAFEERALANKAAYASAHGYELVVVDAVADSVRPAPWSKLTALRDALPRFDWLAYVDGDALFADHRPALETIVDDDYDIVLSEDWGGYNTGVFFIKNSSFSSLLLEEMWSAGDFLAKPNTWYSHPFPFEYEQRALHYFASSAVWRRKHELYPSMVPVVDEAKSLSVTRRIKVVPQCAINSYLVRPTLASLFFDRERRKKSRYRRGDFIVHLAGHKGANKAALFEYALNSLVRG